jgi:hypothetical protein
MVLLSPTPWGRIRLLKGLKMRGSISVAILTVLLLLSLPALAHDHEHPELNGWYQGLHSGKGACCDGSEAVHLADVDWESRDGHYRVRIADEWWDVPDWAVLDEPNRDGRTLVWTYNDWNNVTGKLTVKVRCFMPGTMT